MRKRRSTVYVRPGRDVTLYVPTETPPEVIAYLNHLKDEGVFSQGVMDIITHYVQQTAATTAMPSITTPAHDESAAADIMQATVAVDDWVVERDRGELDWRDAAEDLRLVPEVTTASHVNLSLTQIFRQAQRNSEKLIDDGGVNPMKRT